MSVHNDDPDDVTESSFKRFLCDTPFPDDEVDGDKDQFEGLELKIGENQQNHELVLPTNYISWMGN